VNRHHDPIEAAHMSNSDVTQPGGSPAPPRAKRMRMSKPDRQTQLVDVAERLFVADGYEATTLEDVAREAGVSRPIVYEHFGSKEGLFLACAGRARAEFEREMQAALADGGDGTPAERLSRAGDVFFAMLERDPRRWALLFGSTMAQSGALSDGLDALRLGTIDLVAALLEASTPTLSSEAALACAHALSGVGEQLGRWWQRHPGVPRAQVLTYYTEFIVAGVERIAELETTHETGRP
jgi:AcrR family transcriptional regulator